METVILVDGKNFGFRNAYANISLRNSRGFPTGMFHGGLSGILKLAKTFPDAAIVFCWDGKGPTWRHQTPPYLYKANRAKGGELPPEVRAAFRQFKPFANLVHRVLKFKYLRYDGIEADDLIGLASTALLSKNRQVVIVSSDFDFYQLVSDKISVFKKDVLFTPKKVFTEFGVQTKDWLSYRALTGDSSDNLPGAPGLGPVKARQALSLGLQPGLPFALQCEVVKQKYAALEQKWALVNYCWRMSRIATGIVDMAGCVPSEVLDHLTKALVKLSENPYRGEYIHDDYGQLIKFLGEYELEHLMGLRQLWWKVK